MILRPLRYALPAVLALSIAASADAQAVNKWIGSGAADDWLDSANWSLNFRPEPLLDSVAAIGVDTSDTSNPNTPPEVSVTISTDLTSAPSPTVTLGDGVGFSGTLNIGSGGVLLTASDEFSPTNGDFNVGLNGGRGVLNVSGTGSLDIVGTLTSAGGADAASAIALSGSASVRAAALQLDRSTTLSGPNVSLSSAGIVNLGGAGTHGWEFDPSSESPSVLSAGGQLTLGGVLRIDTLGQTPQLGVPFTIADSAGVSGAFSSIDVAAVPGLGAGVRARVESAASTGSTNGVVTNVVFDQEPVLVINRQTGEATLRNPGAIGTVAFDTYAISSGLGGLNQNAWTTFRPEDGWQVANPSDQLLSELNPLSDSSLDASSSVSLGNVFEPNAAPFGDDHEDVVFRFSPTGGGFVEGVVVYEGIPTDTLTLNIDRNTGDAQLINGFREEVGIDAYLITSESDSLDVTGSGWTGLGGDWQIAVEEGGRVSELNPTNELRLGSNEAAAIGALFDLDSPGAAEDLVFQFALPTEGFFRTGKVAFTDGLVNLGPSTPGDYNGDSVVDAADYEAWRSAFRQSVAPFSGADGNGDGVIDAADYTIWRDNLGAGAVATPEPSAAVLLLAGVLGAAARRR